VPGVFKRKTDRDRGKAGKWTGWYLDEHGKQRQFTGTTDKATTLEIARAKEAEARMVREGMLDRREIRQREAARKPLGDHIRDYRLDLEAKGDRAKHSAHVAGVLRRLLEDAGIRTVAELAPDLIQAALGRLKQRRSARTCNHAMNAVKAFARWLEHSHRIKEVPRGLAALRPYNEKEDRRRVRRAMAKLEIDRLLAAAEAGPARIVSRAGRGGKVTARLSGPERAALYRLAMGTGLRADELRTLTPERFHLEGDRPTVTVLACYSKNGREAVQPITRELADGLRPFLEGKPPGEPVLPFPEKAAKMLRFDLEAAGIPYQDESGRVLDFHALRHSYITHLIHSGADPKTVQELARHSTITLTIDRYSHTDDDRKRSALEGSGPKG
jgi:integrase/recombinase XerD